MNSSALVCSAVPAFWLGQIAILTVALRTGWFPLQGLTDARAQYTGLAHVVDVARHLVLPVLVLAASEVALVTRVTRTGLIQEMGKDYARSARARGLDRPPHPLPLTTPASSPAGAGRPEAGSWPGACCACPPAWSGWC